MSRKYGTSHTSVLLTSLSVLIALNAGSAVHANADTPLFLPAAVYGSGGSVPTSLAVADLNGDGNSDLVTSNTGSTNAGACY